MNTNIIPQIDELSVTFRGRLVKAAFKLTPPVDEFGVVGFPARGGKRGRITDFSRASRKRLLEMFASTDYKKLAIFITLTYGQKFPSVKRAKENLRALLERFRRAYPNMCAVWRIEPQQRGAPHFHLICFNLPFLPYDDLSIMWKEIIGDEYCDNSLPGVVRPPFTRIEAIRSQRRLMRYASKYVAKIVAPEGSSPASPDAEASGGETVGGFIPLAYLHEGRWWGIHNKEHFPWAEAFAVVVRSVDRAFYDFRRGAKKYYPWLQVRSAALGFTLFVNNSEKWLDYWYFCLLST